MNDNIVPFPKRDTIIDRLQRLKTRLILIDEDYVTVWDAIQEIERLQNEKAPTIPTECS